jgi:hypothetical protein
MATISLFPRSDADFFTWQGNFMTNLNPVYPAYGIPENEWNVVAQEQSIFVTKYALAENPETRTSAAVVAKTEARKSYEKALSILIRRRLNLNPAVDDEARRRLGLPIYKTTHTPTPVAADAPAAECDTSVHGRITIHFFSAGSLRKKGKPFGQHGAEIAWVIRDTPPTRWDELLHSVFDTNSPYTFVFENDQRGQTLYYALRWENTRGEKGPWSDIAAVMIP